VVVCESQSDVGLFRPLDLKKAKAVCDPPRAPPSRSTKIRLSYALDGWVSSVGACSRMPFAYKPLI
jgi:hypothetical protein